MAEWSALVEGWFTELVDRGLRQSSWAEIEAFVGVPNLEASNTSARPRLMALRCQDRPQHTDLA